MAAETQYTANTGLIQFNAANTSLTGGTIGTNIFTVLTAASNGTLIKTVTIKSTSTPTQGMVRLWIYDGTNQRLIQEIPVDPIKQGGTSNPSFEKTIKLDLTLKSGDQLLASSEKADTFNVIAQGLDISYFSSYVRPESTNYVANVGLANLSTGNTSLTPSSGASVVQLIAATSSYNGTIISNIRIKATAATTADGIIRFFIYNGTTYFLLTEIFVPATSQSDIYPSFEYQLEFPDTFQLKSGYSIYVTTSRDSTFHIIAEGMDWNYPANTFTNYTNVSFNGDTNEHLLHSYQVPAGLFTTGNLLGVYLAATITNNNHNRTFRIYINSLANGNTLTGATLIGLWIGAFTIGTNMERLFPIINDSTVECYGGTTNVYPNTRNQYSNTTTTSGTVTVPPGANPSLSGGFWLLISGQDNSTLDTTTLRWSMIEKII